jgi:hypothetical protein
MMTGDMVRNHLLDHALVVPLICLSAATARADEPKATATAAGVTGAQCSFKGTIPGPKDTTLFDARTGGRSIGKLTGALVPLIMTDLESNPQSGRAKVVTSTGGGSLRIEGFMAPSGFTFYSEKDIPIVASHVWLAQGHKVKPTQAAANQLTAELTIAGSTGQTVHATAPCDSFSIAKTVTQAVTVPPNGRGYMTKSTSVELYDAPNGTVIFTLSMSAGTGQLFWSTESRAGFVHALARGDLAIDAWVKLRDLEPLKKGEMMDDLAPGQTVVTGAQLALEKPPAVVKATKEIQVRAKRDAKDPIIGVIEVDAEIYLMETMAGWTNVLPKSLGVMPADDTLGFWIPSGEAPAAAK